MFPQLRLVEQIPHEGSLLYFGQTLAFGFDKKGQPIQIQNGGLAGCRFADMSRFVGGQEQVLASLVRFQELQAARMEESSRRLGRPITKQVVITNALGMPLRPQPAAVAAFKDFLLVSSRYYPESLAVLFVVNAPPVFVMLYRVIQTWLDPVTASKIQVLGKDFQSTLLEHIDADQLPRNYGGSVDFDILGTTWSREEIRSKTSRPQSVKTRKPQLGRARERERAVWHSRGQRKCQECERCFSACRRALNHNDCVDPAPTIAEPGSRRYWMLAILFTASYFIMQNVGL
ncbi:unnamed protein product [Effrenium voratum]|nr:unnamed protein product [Effrenium voratum]